MLNAVNDNRGVERRGARRHRVLMSGKVAWLDKPFSSNCTIRNLTEDGAQIRLADPITPDDPVLIVLRSGLAHEARTAWRQGDLVGLEFLATHDLTEPVPAHLEDLRRLWRAQARV